MLLNIRKLLHRTLDNRSCELEIHIYTEINKKEMLSSDLAAYFKFTSFKGFHERQKLCFSAPCGHTAVHEIFGLVHCLIPKISPYVMAAGISYKIS